MHKPRIYSRLLHLQLLELQLLLKLHSLLLLWAEVMSTVQNLTWLILENILLS